MGTTGFNCSRSFNWMCSYTACNNFNYS